MERCETWGKRTISVCRLALLKYVQTDGEQRAASFAYYAFFALFPLLFLLLTITSYFLTNGQTTGEEAKNIIGQIQGYLPDVPEIRDGLMRALQEMWKLNTGAGFLAVTTLIWSALRFFQSLVQGVNRAWGTKEEAWWKLPMKNLLMVVILTSALLFGVLVPAVLDQLSSFYRQLVGIEGLDSKLLSTLAPAARWLVPSLVLFYGFSMFYKFAPGRKTTFREVWHAALFVTLTLNLMQWGFSFYARNFSASNAVYGAFGGVMLLLTWIYLSGSLVIFGGCLSAASYEVQLNLKPRHSEPHKEADK